jgi:hypothetical protein
MKRITKLLCFVVVATFCLIQANFSQHGVHAQEELEETDEDLGKDIDIGNENDANEDDDDDSDENDTESEDKSTETIIKEMDIKKSDQELKIYSDKIVEITSSSDTEYNKWSELTKAMSKVTPMIMKMGAAISKLMALRKKSKTKGASNKTDKKDKKDKKKDKKKKKKKEDKGDSPELKYMKEQFEIVIDGMSRLEHKIDDLENVVVHEETKSVYGEYQRTIENLYYDWEYVQKPADEETRKIYLEMFLGQYYRHYKHAAFNLYNAMTSGGGELNNDLLGTAKQRYKCDGVRIRKLCGVITQTIMKGLAVEGAIYGFQDVLDRATNEEELWKTRMDKLQETCDAIIRSCRTDWKSYVTPVMWDTYNKYKESSNEELASQVYEVLTKTLRQRLWFVFVYDSMAGFDQHGYSSVNTTVFNDVETKWRENGKMFSVVSIDMDEYPHFEELPKLEVGLKRLVEEIAACNSRSVQYPGLAVGQTLFKYTETLYEARSFVTYAIKRNSHLAFRGAVNRFALVSLIPPAGCQALLNYNFNLFIIG